MVYGVVSGLVALALGSLEPASSGVELVAWSFAVMAIILVAVVPVWLPYRHWRARARELGSVPANTQAPADLSQQRFLLDLLVRRGLTYARLVEPVAGHQRVLRLTPFGLRLAAGLRVPDGFISLPETTVLSRRPAVRAKPEWKDRSADVVVYPDERRSVAARQ